MPSNYRRQGFNSRNNPKHLVQKPVTQVVKPTQILKRPDQASSGDKVLSLPFPSTFKPEKEANHVINSCSKPALEISSVVVIASESTKPSRRKPRNRDSKGSPTQSYSKQPTLAYHADSRCSEKTHPSKPRSNALRPTKEPSVDNKEAAAVTLLMVLLNSEVSDQTSALSAFPLKISSKPLKSRVQDDQVISPRSLLELLQSPAQPVDMKPSTKAHSDSYYAAPQFRKPPRLSELPVPPFLTV